MILASWFDDFASTAWEAFVLFVLFVVLAAVAFGVLVLIFWVTSQATQNALREIRETIYEERATSVPAFFILLAGVGAGATQVVVDTLTGSLLAIGVAAITFASATLAERGSNRPARALGIAGCLLPFLVFTVACFASGKFGDLASVEQAILIGCLLVGWLGVLWAVVALGKQPRTSIAQQPAS